MIHLDTNILIALPFWIRERHPVLGDILDGEPVAVCSVVWYEFLSGPVTEDEIRLAKAFIGERVVPIGEAEAERAAKLYNQTGRRRQHRTDTLIAATAMVAGARFVTYNRGDFEAFVKHGLHLV